MATLVGWRIKMWTPETRMYAASVPVDNLTAQNKIRVSQQVKSKGMSEGGGMSSRQTVIVALRDI